MDALIEPLLASPMLYEHLEQLQRVAAVERHRREKFYDDVTPGEKWEFINGEIIMHSPATARHSAVRKRIERLITTWVDLRRLGWAGSEKVLVVFPRNDYEPDLVFFGIAKTALIEPETLKFPVPDFVIEILSPTTATRDRGIKFSDYAAHGVGEYWIVDPEAESIEQFITEGGNYELVAKQQNGSVSSRVIDGLVFPVRAAFDDQENLQALRTLMQA